ncbi:Uncharacterised protein [Mycobacteroides abscessus subsp. abscessus]|nr:Uncharacterised protein [Mycobacteroides abscessus subsp. abscessus]
MSTSDSWSRRYGAILAERVGRRSGGSERTKNASANPLTVPRMRTVRGSVSAFMRSHPLRGRGGTGSG